MVNIECPLSGKVIEIMFVAGKKINEDDQIMTIEAMKMENPIFSNVTGTVKEIKVTVGEQVTEGQVLAIIY